MGERRVVLICGPPGSGKTTLARQLGLTVYDRDDPQWRGEAHFAATIARLKHDPHAQAAVIRSGARSTSRKRAAGAIGATEVQVLDVDAETCIRRVIARGRPRPSIERQIAAVREWWRVHEADRGYNPAAVRRQRESQRYDRAYRAERKRLARVVASGQAVCMQTDPNRPGSPPGSGCVMPSRHIKPGTPWATAHDDSGTVILGPAHRTCNARDAAVRGNRERARTREHRVTRLIL